MRENLSALLDAGVVKHALELVKGGSGREVHAELAKENQATVKSSRQGDSGHRHHHHEHQASHHHTHGHGHDHDHSSRKFRSQIGPDGSLARTYLYVHPENH